MYSMGLGITELALIAFITLIIFGAGKLPKVMGDLGRGIKNFKEAFNEEAPLDGSLKNNTKSIEDTSAT